MDGEFGSERDPEPRRLRNRSWHRQSLLPADSLYVNQIAFLLLVEGSVLVDKLVAVHVMMES